MLNPLAGEEKQESARLSCFVGAVAIGDLLKSTLGPKGMDKILVKSGKYDISACTNDGATIMRSIGIDNPAAKVLVDMAKVQDDEVGDGTTSVVVLAAELLREAERLTNLGIHPQSIIEGWHKAFKVAEDELEKSKVALSFDDPKKFRDELLDIAKIVLSSKILHNCCDHFCELAVDAILRLKNTDIDLEKINIIKKMGAHLNDSFLDDGFILNKRIGPNQPKRLEKARILLANTPMDYDKVKVFGSKVIVDSFSKVGEMEAAEKEKMKDKVNQILKHDINCFINRQLIYNYPEQLLIDAGCMTIEHADFEGVERLATVLGSEIVSTFDTPDKVKLGHCDLIEEIMIGDEKMIKFSGVALGESCTIVIRGSSLQVIDEAERALHDVLCVLSKVVKDPYIVYGGGVSEMRMANSTQKYAMTVSGRESLAVESVANALRQLPTAIADNGGLPSSDIIPQLRALHNEGQNTMGLDMRHGVIADMKQLKIIESFKVKHKLLLAAFEASEAILRVDSILKAAPRKRGGDHKC